MSAKQYLWKYKTMFNTYNIHSDMMILARFISLEFCFLLHLEVTQSKTEAVLQL